MSGLTEEQRAVSEAPVGARQMVIAGPGTGKTHTLVARLAHLVEEEEVFPGAVLALSFSRAAVNELRRRLRASGDDASRIVPVTFDSFATRILANVDPDGEWTTKSFDGRIEAAIGKIAQIGESLDEVKHVVVDELQDLVGVRMRFVRALLKEFDAGFTLLGDPAQGIYDFSLEDEADPEVDGSPALYSWLRETYDGSLVERSLTVNHRARSEVAKEAASLGPMVVDAPAEAGERLWSLLRAAPEPPSLKLVGMSPARTAILCRNNGEALWVSRALRRNGVDHRLQRRAIDRAVAPWVARFARSAGPMLLSRGQFETTLANLEGDVPDPDEVWGALRRAARADAGIDVERLVRRLREGIVPDELHATPDSLITVSTVHRAKGLEFDRVLVVRSGWKTPFDDDGARTLFVALSRTIEDLMQLDLPDIGGRLKKHWSDRWLWTGWKGWPTHGVEVRPDDVDVVNPPGTGRAGTDPNEVQLRLASEVKPGDSVVIERVRAVVGGGAIYRIDSNSGPLGLMNERFGVDIGKTTRGKYPRRIEGVTVDSVRSVGGDPLVADQVGLGPAGAWLVPALSGLGQFE